MFNSYIFLYAIIFISIMFLCGLIGFISYHFGFSNGYSSGYRAARTVQRNGPKIIKRRK